MARSSRSDILFKWMCIGLASSVVLLSGIYFYELIAGSSLTLGQGISFIIGIEWNTASDIYGVFPMLWGSLVTAAIALIIGVPLSVGVAVFLAEIAKGRLRSILSFLVEMLAAVPSVIYGLWGLFILAPVLSTYVYPVVVQYIGFIPIFSCPTTFVPCFFLGGFSVMTAGIILAIMIIPIVAAISRDAMLIVPDSQREAAYALGATKSEMVNMSVLTYARSGIIAAVFLGFARAFGETMAVLMVIGNSPIVPKSLFGSGYTLASLIANQYAEADSPVAISALIEAGLVLLIVSFAASVVGRLLIRRFIRLKEAASYI